MAQLNFFFFLTMFLPFFPLLLIPRLSSPSLSFSLLYIRESDLQNNTFIYLENKGSIKGKFRKKLINDLCFYFYVFNHF